MTVSADAQSAVFVIDDDAAIRDGLARLFRSVGLETKTFASAAEFLQCKAPDVACCMVLDVRLPGFSGLEFQAILNRSGRRVPIVFMTGHADVPMIVRAMKGGAVEFLAKPFREQDMLDAVQNALDLDRDLRKDSCNKAKLKASFESLTSREQQILRFVTQGLMNKQIASRLGLSEISVKVHRGNMMRKMEAKSVAALVWMAAVLGVADATSQI